MRIPSRMTRQPSKRKAAAWVSGWLLLMLVIVVAGKEATRTLHVFQIMEMRSLLGLLLLYPLIHREGAVGPTIGGMAIRTTPLQRLPGVFRHYRHLLPVMPLAARSWRVGDVDLVLSLSHCVAKAVAVPPGVPHVCYCFTPMRYAWDGRAAYLDGWTGRPLRRRMVEAVLDRLRELDRLDERIRGGSDLRVRRGRPVAEGQEADVLHAPSLGPSAAGGDPPTRPRRVDAPG